MPPLEPKGHDESRLFYNFFDHSANDVAMRASVLVQLQCVKKYKRVERLRKAFPNATAKWWEIGGVDDFQKVNTNDLSHDDSSTNRAQSAGTETWTILCCVRTWWVYTLVSTHYR